MNKIYSKPILMLLLVCSSISFAQDKSELKAQALKDAKATSHATLKFDFETVLKHTYPGVVTLMGGKEKAMDLLESTFNSMAQDGFVFEKAEIVGVSDIVYEQDEYRCYIESYNQMIMNNLRIKSKGYLLGIYDTNLKYWYFIEAKQLKNNALMDQVFPSFKTSLVIPDNEMTQEKIEN
ncbi:hypothetical protein [Pontimicrobium aquaticum]|uniref:SnoaL-like domain-containing protein n=1 Tax=Pontimicrobium aquaticum TaxID=2565367 RepID=A0A4U0ESN2_9FLAO|nr:hypothetical protein [Pontimicrobium aquaticum]TJY34795.1 hypothetical protein E5167_10840 [Pontimicrobium aquaticum]